MAATADGQVNITIKAKDETGGVFGKISDRFSSLGKAAIAGAAGGIAVAGAAITGVAVKGISDFIAFEDQMNEVFTLLPGISGAAMDEMRNQVLDVSGDMGRLPEEVIPALYQSLSAGVPTDNVFEFMDTAHKAALGGVTDLETAVDGITSVVNAYGSDVVSAANASDVMFTAVRLGKTDFNQLSRSLFNVIPTAASLGVSFEDVSASLATLTGQGTPTSVATTQIRSALVEASKGGTKLDKAIQDLTGSSFAELIDQGTSMPGIFQALRASMSDQEFKDLFGSVEALNAVLGITGPNFETVEGAMESMNSSAGATDAAFDTMNQGMARTLEVMKAKFATTFIKIGDALAPFVRIIGDKVLGALENLEPVLTRVTGFIEDFFGVLFGKDLGGFKTAGIVDKIQAIIDTGGSLRDFFTIFEDGSTNLDSLFEIFGMGEEEAQALGQKISELATKFFEIKDAVVEFITPIWEAITNFVSLKDVFIALGIVIAATIIPIIASLLISIASVLAPILLVIGIVALLRNAWENNWGGIQEKTQAVIEFVRNIITTVMEFIRAFWAQNGEQIKATALQVWNAIQNAVSTVIEFIRNIITTVLTAIQTFWSQHGEQIKTLVQTYFEFVRANIETVLNVIKNIFNAFKSAFQGDWRSFGEYIRAAWDTIWNRIKAIIQQVVPAIIRIIQRLITGIRQKFQSVNWGEVGRKIIDGIAKGIRNGVGLIKDAARNAARAALDAAKGFLGISSPSRVFADVGLNVGEGFVQGIVGKNRAVSKAIGELITIPKTSVALDAGFGAPVLDLGSLGGAFPQSAGGSVTNNEFHLHLTTSDPEDVLSQFELMQAMVIE